MDDNLRKINSEQELALENAREAINSIVLELNYQKTMVQKLVEYLNRISTETLLAYGVYQVEADGLELFEYIKGDRDSIMGLPIKQIIDYINQYKK